MTTHTRTHITVASLTKVYPGPRRAVTALRDVSFTVPEGQFCALIGPSGCGKTTLLHLLAGLIEPTSGTVTMPRSEPGRLATAMVFQGISTFPWMTVVQNVEYGLRVLGVPARTRRQRAAIQVHRVGLWTFRDAFPYQLSEGMRQRVSIARAFATDPDILLMDEPFANLDEQTRLHLQDELLRLWQESRKTVLFVTHSLDEAVRMSDRVLVMTAAPGRIKTEVVVPLARPRSYRETRRDPAYGMLTARLWDELELAHAEVEESREESR
jgi:NitT/TauT family transport system ATP-binding protein